MFEQNWIRFKFINRFKLSISLRKELINKWVKNTLINQGNYSSTKQQHISDQKLMTHFC